MRVHGRTLFFGVSFAAHLVLAGALAAIPRRVVRETIAITIAEAKKAPPTAKVDPVPKAVEAPAAAPRAARAAKAAPPPPATAAPPNPAPASAGLDALPDFGLSLSGTGGGLAVPAAAAAAAPPASASPKVVERTLAPRPADECDDPPAKPKLVSHPSPAYTEDARNAGVTGKVRVEIAVDEHGAVTGVRLLQGLGHGLDEAALAAARGARFEPAVRCGKPAAGSIRVGFTFAP
jgi:protein TonB